MWRLETYSAKVGIFHDLPKGRDAKPRSNRSNFDRSEDRKTVGLPRLVSRKTQAPQAAQSLGGFSLQTQPLGENEQAYIPEKEHVGMTPRCKQICNKTFIECVI